MSNIKKIIPIPVEEIYQHPDNPRKDLGELTELSASIKKKGVMQNLTVIPGHWDEKRAWHENGYTLIIGHRRCAAAKLAGLKELPCRVVDDMSQKDQVGTMLEENMQRNDLTIWEQANGFQMMLDLGDTEEQIAEKTGFSKTTIRHRLNIAKLDQKELRKKEKNENFQLSLKDLYELEKIEDIKTRNRVLKDARDSRDLVWQAKQAVTEEKRTRNKKLFENLFKKAGIKKAPKGTEGERYSGKWDILQEWGLEKDAPKTLKKFKEDNVQWVVFWGTAMAVIAPAKKQKRELSEYEIREKERKKAKKELKQRYKAMYDDVDRFIMGIISKEIEPLKEDVELYKALVAACIKGGGVSYSEWNLAKLYSGKDLYDLKHNEPEKYKKFLEWKESLSPLHLAIAYMSGIKEIEMYGYNAEYRKESADKVKAVIDFLALYGFSVSEKEQKLIDGTHELYRKQV